LKGSDLLATASVEATLSIENAQCEREGETEIGLAQIPPCYLLNTLKAIGGGVAMYAQ
jgi:hypothetical protein